MFKKGLRFRSIIHRPTKGNHLLKIAMKHDGEHIKKIYFNETPQWGRRLSLKCDVKQAVKNDNPTVIAL